MRARLVPTWEQMRVLADRAERGPLTADEAARLRAGLQAMEARLRCDGYERAQLVSVQAFVRRARQRGTRRVSLMGLTRALEPGQRPPAATSVGALSASDTAGLSRTGPEKGAVRPRKPLSAVRRPPPGTASPAAV